MKKAALSLCVIITTLVLAGCNPAANDLGVENGRLGKAPTETNLSKPGEPAPSPTSTTQTIPKKGGMKTIADFEKIAASEVTIKTTKGDITFEIYTNKVPLTAANFLNLAKSGYYDGVVFHRVIPDFMAQVGDPLSKDESKKTMWGTGGPGYTIADEFDPSLKHDTAGVVSMANAGPNTGGSQFFITYEATPWLDGKHAVFGKVTTGMDVLEKIEIGDKIISVSYK